MVNEVFASIDGMLIVSLICTVFIFYSNSKNVVINLNPRVIVTVLFYVNKACDYYLLTKILVFLKIIYNMKG